MSDERPGHDDDAPEPLDDDVIDLVLSEIESEVVAGADEDGSEPSPFDQPPPFEQDRSGRRFAMAAPHLSPLAGPGPDALRVLGIETSCDETAAAVVVDARHVLSSVVSSQVDLHARFGGVVPEIASRAHVELLTPVVAQALIEAGLEESHVDAVACTTGPGLIGALLVGVSAAKALALVWDVPFVAVNHLEAHLYAAFLEEPEIELPLVVLLVSGGHTMLVLMEGHGQYRLLGSTIDDAAGEAFDKVARYLGLGYPGGPAIDRISLEGDPHAIRFPRPIIDEGCDFSFSGLKTAVVNHVRKNPEVDTADVAASFQEAVVDVLVTKARRAVREHAAVGLCLAGGVAANSMLRERTLDACMADGIHPFLPSRSMCTDNAAMVAAAGWWRLQLDGPSPLDTGATPNLKLPTG
jgi:N6-L-threonylcarbamoyladenine synthase